MKRRTHDADSISQVYSTVTCDVCDYEMDISATFISEMLCEISYVEN